MHRVNRLLPLLALAVLLAARVPISGQETRREPPTPPVPAEKQQPARTLLSAAMKKAQASKKRVFVLFDASWCGWCKRLHAAMEKDELRKPFADNYVVVTLHVQEAEDKKRLETPGGDKALKELGGEKAGLPFYAILDAKGKKLADANAMPEDKNIGYPAEPAEIEAFVQLLKKTAPRLTDAQLATIQAFLTKNAPSPQREGNSDAHQ